MKDLLFYSGDFAKVPSALIAEIPKLLLHKGLLDSEARDHDFSSERKHRVSIAHLPSKILSMTLGGLEPGQSTREHRHNYETLIYVIKGNGRSFIDGGEILWSAGDAFYVPVWAWHRHENTNISEEALYIACENAPMLQNLGIALREERPDKRS